MNRTVKIIITNSLYHFYFYPVDNTLSDVQKFGHSDDFFFFCQIYNQMNIGNGNYFVLVF